MSRMAVKATVSSPDRPMMSGCEARAASRNSCAGTFTPRSSTVKPKMRKREHGHVLADVVDVARDRAEEHAPGDRPHRVFHAAGTGQVHDSPEDLAGHDEAGQEDLLRLVALADDAHALFHGLQYRSGVELRGDGLGHEAEGLLLVEGGDGGGERARSGCCSRERSSHTS